METIVCYDISTGMNEGALRRSRITRNEAAKVLGTSYQNVRRLQRVGQLRSDPDRYGVHRFDRREVEELARKRGLQIKPSGELAAHVFALFKERRSFADVVIDTKQEPSVIADLWRQYCAGYPVKQTKSDDDARAQSQHEQQMREIDRELERRRSTG